MSTRKIIPREVMQKLPKAELHRHLDGSVRVSTIIDLAREQGVKLPTFDEAELRALVSVDEKCESLVQYLRGFDITLLVLQRSYALTRTVYEEVEDAFNDGVKYLEIRFSPVLHTRQGLSQAAVMEAVCEGVTLARLHFPVMVQIIVCAMRQLPSNETEKIAEIAWRYRHKGVCGFDLAGPEMGFSSKLHRSAFNIVRQKCINCTLHSGEAAGWESIRDAIRYCGANRIGHGVQLTGNAALMEYMVSHRIAIECCPTSNVHTKAIKHIEDHPIRKFFDAGAIVVPCTDNTTVSSVTLTGEYMVLQEKLGFTVEEVIRMLDYGFQAAFATTTERRRLRADALNQTLRILAAEGLADPRQILHDEVNYHSIGLDAASLGLQCIPRPVPSAEVAVTEELIRSLPKTDLHCRLDGSISAELLWKELADAKVDLRQILGREPPKTADELRKLMASAESSPELQQAAKELTMAVLQNPDQIRRAVDDVLKAAARDGVTYMELMIRPLAHLAGGMTAKQVVDTAMEACRVSSAAHAVHVGIVIYVSPTADDPIAFREMAQLAVEERDLPDSLVVGFGVYGDQPIPAESFRFFLSTFEFLKSHNMNVAMVAGLQGVGTILTALHEGGASRISGAFQIHTFPRLANYLATRGVAVEMSLTLKLHEFTKDATFAGSPLRLFIDNDIPVTICSFRGLFVDQTRVETLMGIVRDCDLSVIDLLRLLENGFRFNFQSYASQQKLLAESWERSKEYLSKAGFKDFYPFNWFPHEK